MSRDYYFYRNYRYLILRGVLINPDGLVFFLVDRFAESYSALLNTAVRAAADRLTAEDRQRIPSKHSCDRLLELCAQVHQLARCQRNRP